MKNGLYKLMLFISAFLLSCNHSTNNTALRSDNNYKLINYPEQCFIAIYQKDSAFLKFKTMPNGKIRGKLTIKYSELQSNDLEKEFDHGEIIGQFKKDTLFADYIFTDGTKSTIYKNPIALLKKNQKLVLGFGAIINYLGKSWFINHKAINFKSSRFQFLPSECNN
jgi:hypothetical protein